MFKIIELDKSILKLDFNIIEYKKTKIINYQICTYSIVQNQADF